MDPTTNNPGNPAVPTDAVVPPVPTPAPAPVSTVATPGTTDWEASYKGLQGTYNKLFNDHKDLEAKYNTLLTDHEKIKQDAARAATELGTASTGLQTKDQEIAQHKTEIENQKAQYQRLKLIAQKFPNLIVMEEQGLIPAMKPEELEPKLDALNKSILESIDNRAKASLQAAPPGPSSNNNNIPPVENEDEVYEKLTKLAGSKKPEDIAEYKRLDALYMQLKSKPK